MAEQPTIERLEEALINAHNANDANAAKVIADELRRFRTNPNEKINVQNVAAQAGAGIPFANETVSAGIGALEAVTNPQFESELQTPQGRVDVGKAIDTGAFGLGAGPIANVSGQREYSRSLQGIEGRQQEFRDANPKTAMASELGGSMLIGGAGGRLATTPWKAAGVAAAEGGLFGASENKDNRLLGAAQGAITGATMSGIVSRITKAIKTGRINRALVKGAPDDDQIYLASKEMFKRMDASGVKMKPGSYSRLKDQINLTLSEMGFDAADQRKLAPVLKSIKNFDSPTFKELGILESRLSNLAVNPQDPSAGNMARAVRGVIDDFVTQNADSFTGSSKELIAAQGAARELWGRHVKNRIVNETLELAKLDRSSTEIAIKRRFSDLLKKIRTKKVRGFNDDEVKAIENIVDGEKISTQLGRFGLSFDSKASTNLLPAALGITGGPMLGPVLVAGTTAAKVTSRKLLEREAKLASAVTRAGKNGKKIVEAYLDNIPKKNRSFSDLASLLIDGDISKIPIKPFDPADRQFIMESVNLATSMAAANIGQQALQ